MRDLTNTSDEDALLGFLAMSEDPDSVRCGLLVTDLVGAPKEFRATEPSLRPTRVQRIIYGASLDDEIARICGEPLVSALRYQPAVLFADRKEFLRLDRDELRVITIKAHGETLEVEQEAIEGDDPLSVGQGREVRMVVPLFAEGVSEDSKLSVRESLPRLLKFVDPIEVFERVRQALAVLDRSQTQG